MCVYSDVLKSWCGNNSIDGTRHILHFLTAFPSLCELQALKNNTHWRSKPVALFSFGLSRNAPEQVHVDSRCFPPADFPVSSSTFRAKLARGYSSSSRGSRQMGYYNIVLNKNNSF